MARTIAALAFFGGHVEEHGFDVAAVVFGEHDVGPALIGREVGRVNISYRASQFQTMFQQVAQDPKHASMNGLVSGIVAKQAPDFVAG